MKRAGNKIFKESYKNICMKRILLVLLLLLIPFAYAQKNQNDSILQAQKANLDFHAATFISEMDNIIQFAASNNITTDDLNKTESDFETNLQKGLGSQTTADLAAINSEMKTSANDFVNETDILLGSYSYEINTVALKFSDNQNKIITEKEQAAVLADKGVLKDAFDQKIQDLTAEINSNTEKGKSSVIANYLLGKFKEQEQSIDSMNVTISGQPTANFITSLFSVISQKFTEIKAYFETNKVGAK